MSHGGICVELIISTNVSGSLSINNLTFDNTATQANGCMSSASVVSHFINIKTGSGVTSLTVTHSTFKGEAATMASPNYGTADTAINANTSTPSSLTAQYNAYVDLPDRGYGGTFANVLSQQEYINGFNELACTTPPPGVGCPTSNGVPTGSGGAGTHGEFIFSGFAPNGTGSITGNVLTMTAVNGAPAFHLQSTVPATVIGGLTGSVSAFCSGSNCITSGTVVTGTGGSSPVTLPCTAGGCIGTVLVSPSQSFASGKVADVTTGTQEYDYDFCGHALFSTTCFYVSTGGGYNQAGIWSTALLQYNTIIATDTVSGSVGNSSPLMETAYNYLPNGVTLIGNYVDFSGGGNWSSALQPGTCGTTSTFSGNVNMVSGNPLTTWAVNTSSGC